MWKCAEWHKTFFLLFRGISREQMKSARAINLFKVFHRVALGKLNISFCALNCAREWKKMKNFLVFRHVDISLWVCVCVCSGTINRILVIRWRNCCLISVLTLPIKHIFTLATIRSTYMFIIKSRKGLAELVYDCDCCWLLANEYLYTFNGKWTGELGWLMKLVNIIKCLFHSRHRRRRKQEKKLSTAIINYWWNNVWRKLLCPFVLISTIVNDN